MENMKVILLLFLTFILSIVDNEGHEQQIMIVVPRDENETVISHIAVILQKSVPKGQIQNCGIITDTEFIKEAVKNDKFVVKEMEIAKFANLAEDCNVIKWTDQVNYTMTNLQEGIEQNVSSDCKFNESDCLKNSQDIHNITIYSAYKHKSGNNIKRQIRNESSLDASQKNGTYATMNPDRANKRVNATRTTPYPMKTGYQSTSLKQNSQLRNSSRRSTQSRNITRETGQFRNNSRQNIQSRNKSTPNVQSRNNFRKSIQSRNNSTQNAQLRNNSTQNVRSRNNSRKNNQSRNNSTQNAQSRNNSTQNSQSKNNSRQNVQFRNNSRRSVQSRNNSRQNVQSRNITRQTSSSKRQSNRTEISINSSSNHGFQGRKNNISTSQIESEDDTTEGYDGWDIIYPGTKWCGAGSTAGEREELGRYSDTDNCCRAHDLCNDTMAPGEKKYNLTNKSTFTKLNCRCDDEFYDCLMKVNSFVSNKIGNVYFNILRRQCYTYDYPLTENCQTYRSFMKITCKEYARNTEGQKIYQWKDAKTYRKLPIPGLDINIPFT